MQATEREGEERRGEEMLWRHALSSVSCPSDGVSEHALSYPFIKLFYNSKVFGLPRLFRPVLKLCTTTLKLDRQTKRL